MVRPTRHNSSAFTLTELVLSVGIMGILLTGIGSAILIASHAIPERDTTTEALLAASEVVDQMAGELHCALAFTERTASAITFEVADRNSDLANETIRYAWSGTSGDPLTRQYNGGVVVDLLKDVREFALSYELKTVIEQPDPVTNESAETVLAMHSTASVAGDFPITDKEWIGQYFQPALPVDALEWKVTRVSFMARVHGGNRGITAVQLRLPAAGNVPSATVLEETLMYESALGDLYQWEEFLFSSVSGLSPTQGLCLVLALNKKDTHLADIQYDDAAGTSRLTTTNAGLSWASDGGKSMLFSVAGTVTTQTTPDPITHEWLRDVGVVLRVGSDPTSRVETSTQIMNSPEVSVP